MSTRDLWDQIDAETPTASADWRNKSVEERTALIQPVLEESRAGESLTVFKCLDDGEVFFAQQTIIPASERAELLLDLEAQLKTKIDRGLTVWIEPQGDKSSLRKLRGVEVQAL